MTWQVDGQHIPPVIAEVAALQAKRGMVEPGAVDENHGRLLRLERVRGRVCESFFVIERKIHQALVAALSERSRSSIRSRASSRPTERRTVPGPMPAFFRSSSLMR